MFSVIGMKTVARKIIAIPSATIARDFTRWPNAPTTKPPIARSRKIVGETRNAPR